VLIDGRKQELHAGISSNGMIFPEKKSVSSKPVKGIKRLE
jgi:hypothetical protein